MDGRAAGETPLAIRDLRPGTHHVRLSLEGHAPAELTFEVPEGTSALPLSFVMPALLAPAEIHSDPEAATISVDNRVIGLTPIQKLSLNPGAHEIRFERVGFLAAFVMTLLTAPLAKFQPDLLLVALASSLSAAFASYHIRRRIQFLRLGAAATAGLLHAQGAESGELRDIRVEFTIREPKPIRLEVRDWGHGFEAEAGGRDAGAGERVGLAGMRERIAQLGGRWSLDSRPGEGTRVVAEVPLELQEAVGRIDE